MDKPLSRYSAVTRRAFACGLSAAAIVGVVGCTSPATSSTTAAAPAASSTATAPGTATSAAPASTTTPATASGEALPASASATVTWTFAASGGRSRNPYMAVWIEDADGNFVTTLALYHKANGDNWLNTLASWYAASGGTDTTTSGTVPAGSFTATWDGSTAAGERAEQGTYYVCIESVVEHGSESLVREQVTFGSSAAQTTLTPVGDISAAAVSFTA